MSEAQDRSWSISVTKEEFSINLYKEPLFWSLASNAWWGVQELTGHVMCCNLPEVFWEIPVSDEKYDDGTPSDTIAHRIYNWAGKIDGFLTQKQEQVASIPLTKEQAQEVDSEFVEIFEEPI
jgi:hypothetical protein